MRLKATNCCRRQPNLKNVTLQIILTLSILKIGKTYTLLPASFSEKVTVSILNDINFFLITDDIEVYEKYKAKLAPHKILHITEKFLTNKKNTIDEKNYPGMTSNMNKPAYILYTAGSTASPKGVIVKQHSILRLVKNT